MQDLAGKTAFVSGAASGIGLAAARAFAAEGMNVVLADRDEAGAAAAAAELRAGGARALALALDVADPASWRSATERTLEEVGEVDLLMNNAGVGAARLPVEEIPAADWDWLFSINLGGVRNGLSAWLPRMKARGGPAHVVNTASILGHFALAGAGDYVASKYAVLGLSETLRIELAGGPIKVSVLCPGFVATPLRANAGRDRPSTAGGPETPPPDTADRPQGIPAERVAEHLLAGIKADRFWIGTHPEYLPTLEARAAEIGAAFAGPSEGEDVTALAGAALAAARGEL